MDFVDWCTHVLRRMVALSEDSPEIQDYGLLFTDLACALFGDDEVAQADFESTPAGLSLGNALSGLAGTGLIAGREFFSGHWVTPEGHAFLNDPTDIWSAICSVQLPPREEELLTCINRLSPSLEGDYPWLRSLPAGKLLPHLDWQDALRWISPVGNALDDKGLAVCRRVTFGVPEIAIHACAQYKGLVWETRRDWTLASRFIDRLRVQGETANVDFKRELHITTNDQKAEFIKDVLALANTPVSETSRWLIIGLEPKRYEYYGGVCACIAQERIEDLLGAYTEPMVNARFRPVQHREGLVGQIEVVRDQCSVPYRVKQSLYGSKPRKSLEQGTVYLRRGTHIAKASTREIRDLDDEAERAKEYRARQQSSGG